MLQQTQAPRVIEKYNEFIKRFPTVKDLAIASNSDVLAAWQGLGYNRRALFLKKSAEKIVSDYHGIVPSKIEELITLPGIGHNTACAIVTFSFNIPTVFIETNIRTVFIHHFFKDTEDVSDKEIIKLVEKTVDTDNPRGWYYALMDYGVFLKKEFKNPSRKSKAYLKQSKFEGSRRQVRGEVIRRLLEHVEDVLDDIDKGVLDDLEKEKIIKKKNGVYTIA